MKSVSVDRVVGNEEDAGGQGESKTKKTTAAEEEDGRRQPTADSHGDADLPQERQTTNDSDGDADIPEERQTTTDSDGGANITEERQMTTESNGDVDIPEERQLTADSDGDANVSNDQPTCSTFFFPGTKVEGLLLMLRINANATHATNIDADIDVFTDPRLRLKNRFEVMSEDFEPLLLALLQEEQT